MQNPAKSIRDDANIVKIFKCNANYTELAHYWDTEINDRSVCSMKGITETPARKVFSTVFPVT